ncbi:RCC1 domain-containing protein [Paractinoplanes durhamensis]|uniref:RCC1 domain-containing protein n=1 Tax=Paractinoplanes durhamensis TaxID=113563 RepID=UPI0036354E55
MLGENGYGQLGGTSTYQTLPLQTGTATNWSKVGAGDNSVCATRTDGSLWCWGNNMAAQLGDGTTTSRYAPTRVGTATTWSGDFAVDYHSCGLRTDGTLWCWGNNANGQLGDGTTTQRSAPGQVTLS